MQMKWMEPSIAVLGELAESSFEEARELGARHLAGGHGELAMMGLTETADVTAYGHVVRRVGEHHLRTLTPHEAFKCLRLGCVARREGGDPRDARGRQVEIQSRASLQDEAERRRPDHPVLPCPGLSIKRSTSCVSKPMTPISKSISASNRNWSSVARISSSHPAF